MRNKLSDAIKLANKSAIMLGSVAAVAMIGIPSIAFAQNSADQVEEVLVTGIRGALQNAVDIKRNSTAVVDAVSAEDVGKFPDSDVGESLGRIPGVTVGRAFGQGASVSIRGAAPQMTLTQLNGQNVASTGWYDQVAIDRTFNYSLLPSEAIAGMDVYKSSQADLNEGGIGGTVIVKTRKPLDMDANTAFLSAKGTIGTVSDELAPEAAGLYSWKNEAESFGILAAVSKSDAEYIRTGDESDMAWSAAVVPTTFIQQRERTTVNLAAQFAPTEALQFGLNYMSLELVGDNTNTSVYLFGAGGTCEHTNVSNVCDVRNISAAQAVPAFGQTWARIGTMTSDTYTFDASYEVDGVKLSTVIGRTEADGGTDLTTNFGFYPLASWSGVIDASGRTIDINGPKHVTTVDQLSDTRPEGWAIGKGPNSDAETYAQFDLEFEVDLGAIKSFKTGFRTTDHDVKKSSFKGTLDPATALVDASNYYGGNIDLGLNGSASFPEPKASAMYAVTRANVTQWREERSGYATLNELNDAAYGMLTFEAEGVRGNIGLRYVNSDVTGVAYALYDGSDFVSTDLPQNEYYSYEKTTTTANYNDILPSLNASFDLSESLVLRVAAAEAISRANYQDMFTSASQIGYQDTIAGNESITTGSIGLLPMKSRQADLGLEYYYGDGNLISATYFIKDINNFAVADSKFGQPIGLVSPDSGLDSWTVNNIVNAQGGKIDGVEFQWSHAFENGFGTVINYTYANGSAPGEVFSDAQDLFTESSKDSFNLVGYWENDVFSSRAAYNWRSEYIIREVGYYGNRMHDDYGQLDLSFAWNATDSITVTFDAINVLEEDDIQYGISPASSGVKQELRAEYPAWAFAGEARYTLGVGYKF